MSLFVRVLSVIVGVLVLLLSPSLLLAATNPISYSASGSLPSSTTVGQSYEVDYTLTNHLPFAVTITQISRSISGTGFTVIDDCSGESLGVSGTCPVEVRYHPSAAGAASIQLSMQYNRNVVPLPALTTTTTGGETTSVSGAKTVELPGETVVGNAYPFEFTFTNSGTESVDTTSSAAPTVTNGELSAVVDHCTSQPLAHHGDSCTVSGTYTPSEAGAGAVTDTYVYSDGQAGPLTTTTTASGSTPSNCVTTAVALELPATTYQYADNVVKFKFTNHCGAAVTMASADVTATLNGTDVTSSFIGTNGSRVDASDCITRGSLSDSQSCTVSASVVPSSTGSNLVVTGNLTYGLSKTATATTTPSSVLANDSSERMVTIVNQCPMPVWISFQAAAAPGTPTPDCKDGHVCPTGTICDASSKAKLCYWINPSLDGQHPNGGLLAAQTGKAPDTMNITIPESNGGATPLLNVLYNAGIIARLGCTATGDAKNPVSCIVNNCGGTVSPKDYTTQSDGQCQPGVGALTTPGMSFNAVEFTFLKDYISADNTTDGVYDEQTINGVNVPMEIKGRGAESSDSTYNNCQPSGATIQPTTGDTQTQLGACSYEYTTPTVPTGARASDYRFVYPGSQSCAISDGQCTTAGEVCGLSYTVNPGHTTYITKMCGTLEGYVSINTGICSQASTQFDDDGALQSLYNCTTKYPNSTLDYFSGADLYACTGTYAGNSCYNPDTHLPATSCCGCANWWDHDITVPPSPATSACGDYVNSSWTSLVQPQVQWMKEACPTAYSYQYDDPSSSFHCTVVNDSNEIVTNYQVTLCPGGKTVSTLTN